MSATGTFQILAAKVQRTVDILIVLRAEINSKDKQWPGKACCSMLIGLSSHLGTLSECCHSSAVLPEAYDISTHTNTTPYLIFGLPPNH